jgi:hypothetical protein
MWIFFHLREKLKCSMWNSSKTTKEVPNFTNKGMFSSITNILSHYLQKLFKSPIFFDTVMYVLHQMIERAKVDGLLYELAPNGLRHWISMYDDDVVTLVRPYKTGNWRHVQPLCRTPGWHRGCIRTSPNALFTHPLLTGACGPSSWHPSMRDSVTLQVSRANSWP